MVGILCINYQSDGLVQSFSAEVRETFGDQARVVCADCSPKQPSAALQREAAAHDGFDYVPTGGNVGYFGGAARALDVLRTDGLPDWVVVSNTDISFPDPDLFEKLARRHRGGPYDVIAPALWSSHTGANQNPHLPERPSRRRLQNQLALTSSYVAANAYHALAYAKGRVRGLRRSAPAGSGPPRPIYAPHGAFIVFRRSYFEGGGDLAYGGFLYGEEVFIGETARRLGLRVGYDPALVVQHDEHATTKTGLRIFRSRQSLAVVHESYRHLLDTYYS